MADGITSANVVGYQNLTLDTTARNFIGATFQPINDAMKLGDIGVNELFVPISDSMYTINGFGGVQNDYFYVDADTASAFGGEAGWYLSDDINDWNGESELTCQNNVALSVGEASPYRRDLSQNTMDGKKQVFRAFFAYMKKVFPEVVEVRHLTRYHG